MFSSSFFSPSTPPPSQEKKKRIRKLNMLEDQKNVFQLQISDQSSFNFFDCFAKKKKKLKKKLKKFIVGFFIINFKRT